MIDKTVFCNTCSKSVGCSDVDCACVIVGGGDVRPSQRSSAAPEGRSSGRAAVASPSSHFSTWTGQPGLYLLCVGCLGISFSKTLK